MGRRAAGTKSVGKGTATYRLFPVGSLLMYKCLQFLPAQVKPGGEIETKSPFVLFYEHRFLNGFGLQIFPMCIGWFFSHSFNIAATFSCENVNADGRRKYNSCCWISKFV